MPAKPALIIDKNVLQGWSKQRLADLADRFELLMPDVLFFELMSTGDHVARARCFSKLPGGENPITLVEHLGAHLSHELTHQAPLGKPSTRRAVGRFRFNPLLSSADYRLPDEQMQATLERTEYLRQRSVEYLERARTAADIVARRIAQTGEKRPAAFEALREQVLDLEQMRDFISDFEAPEGEPRMPPTENMDRSWAIFVHQVVAWLFALDMAERRWSELHQPGFAEANAVKLEHDVLDAEYLALGVLEGGLATHERKLRSWFRLLCPDGVLIPEAP